MLICNASTLSTDVMRNDEDLCWDVSMVLHCAGSLKSGLLHNYLHLSSFFFSSACQVVLQCGSSVARDSAWPRAEHHLTKCDPFSQEFILSQWESLAAPNFLTRLMSLMLRTQALGSSVIFLMMLCIGPRRSKHPFLCSHSTG